MSCKVWSSCVDAHPTPHFGEVAFKAAAAMFNPDPKEMNRRPRRLLSATHRRFLAARLHLTMDANMSNSSRRITRVNDSFTEGFTVQVSLLNTPVCGDPTLRSTLIVDARDWPVHVH